MNIKVENHGWAEWTAIDSDTYDGPGGPGEKGSPVGCGRTEMGAITDLVEQIIERLEDKIDDQRHEIGCIRAENKSLQAEVASVRNETAAAVVNALNRANRIRLEGKPPETQRQEARGEVFITPSAVPTLPENQEVTTGLLDDTAPFLRHDDKWDDRCQGRMSDEQEQTYWQDLERDYPS